MPLDGSSNYQYPLGTRGIPDQTIESEAYNTFLDDLVVNDLNIPRPLHRGGTGANTADQALVNLTGEKAAQVVTNFDSHFWQPGSFYSSTATGQAAPIDGHAFAGICYVNEPLAYPLTNQNLIVEARDQSDTIVPGRVYVRQKKAGVWDPEWIEQVGGTTKLIEIADARYVNLNGDTMLGALYTTLLGSGGDVHAGGDPYFRLNKTGNDRTLYFDASTYLQLIPGTYRIVQNNTVVMTFAAGQASAYGNLSATGTVSAVGVTTTGNITAGGSIAATSNVTASGLVGSAGDVYAGGDPYFRMTAGPTQRNLMLGVANNANYLQFDNAYGYRLVVNNVVAYTVDGAGNFECYASASKPGGGMWAVGSDVRIKNVEGDYTRGLEQIAALRPIYYTFKGNDTPVPPAHPEVIANPAGEPPAKQRDTGPLVAPYPNSPHYKVASDQTRYAGLIAQEVEAVFPEAVKQHSGYIDGTAVTDLRDLDTTPLVFALINAVKELKQRVEELENPT